MISGIWDPQGIKNKAWRDGIKQRKKIFALLGTTFDPELSNLCLMVVRACKIIKV